MKTYVFTYFGEGYNCYDFRVNANRFSQAYASFCVHLNTVSKNIKICGFSHSYKVISNSKSRYCFLSYNRLLALEIIKDKCYEN